MIFMAQKANVPYAGFTVRQSLIYILSYSFGVPIALFTPFLIAKAFNQPLAQQVGLSPQNIYTFLIFAGLAAAIVTFLILRWSLRSRGTAWHDLGIKRFSLLRSAGFISSGRS